eukprot:COSAG06_NODE_2910_length_6103_cov_2.350600_2_plen_219_part_00
MVRTDVIIFLRLCILYLTRRSEYRLFTECKPCATVMLSTSYTLFIVALASMTCFLIWRCYMQGLTTADESQASTQISNPLSNQASGQTRANDERGLGVFLLIRSLYQPARILIGWGQIVSKLGVVLHVTLPPMVSELFSMLEPLAADLQAVLHLDCFTAFHTKWLIKIFVVPAIGLALIFLRYAQRIRRGEDRDKEADKAKDYCFVLVFIFCKNSHSP